jgi:hypothetical protein
VNAKAHTTFFYPDGTSKSSIRLQVADWSHISARTERNSAVRGEWKQGAFEFTIVPGENYELH